MRPRPRAAVLSVAPPGGARAVLSHPSLAEPLAGLFAVSDLAHWPPARGGRPRGWLGRARGSQAAPNLIASALHRALWPSAASPRQGLAHPAAPVASFCNGISKTKLFDVY